MLTIFTLLMYLNIILVKNLKYLKKEGKKCNISGIFND